uniref:Glycogen debranching enzyme n=1 Tax=Lepeophtheirus salmonis TaxID=72036 RepID=A0A0K2SWV7_LEPSM
MLLNKKDVDEVRLLSLHLGQKGESVLYRLNLHSKLQFRIDPSLFGKKVHLWINYPKDNTTEFDRSSYKELPWINDSGNDDTASYIDFSLHLPGSFHFYFTLDGSKEINGDGYFLVDPDLKAGRNSESIPLDCLQCQTVLAKNLGPFKTWENKLNVSHEAGYNLLHFTPVQVIGESKSAYSLADQHALNPEFECTWEDLKELIIKMNKEWSMLSLCDIVLNHTANESEWVTKDVSATYNLECCRHLTPAYLLDRIIFRITLDIAEGKWVDKGIPKGIVSEEAHLGIIKTLFYEHYYPQVNLHEYFLVDVDSVLLKFNQFLRYKDNSTEIDEAAKELKLIPNGDWTRKSAEIDFHLAAKLYSGPDGNNRLRCKLEELNAQKSMEIWNHIHAGIDNVIKGARYHRIDSYGPRINECSEKEPLVCQYFTGSNGKNLSEEEESLDSAQERSLMMSHNGWVMNYDPVKDVDFVDPKSNILLRRELIAWGDSVKLRYGESYSDSPYLWDYMTKYVEQMAEIFYGLRLDNCHSTPIHVAEYLLDKARKIRPNLYVIAELFTSSEASDNVFINRLGINSLIRENLQAGDSHELGRLIHRFGGEPVGAFNQLKLRPLVPSMAHAVLFEQTHDNPSPIEKRSVYDSLTSGGLIAMACCATGANRGVDELVPHHIHVVNETRTYDTNTETGMIKIKKLLNELHWKLGVEGFNECYVDQMDPDVVAITRHNKITHESIVMVAHTAFGSTPNLVSKSHLRCLEVEGILGEIVLEAQLKRDKNTECSFTKDTEVINGLSNYKVDYKTRIQPSESDFAQVWTHEEKTIVKLNNFVPGSLICLRFEFNDQHTQATKHLQKMLSNLKDDQEFKEILNDLSLDDINHILFRCDQEERDFTGGCSGVYVLDGYGPLKYAGLQGVMSILSDIRSRNDLGNWLPSNLRAGNWMMDYIHSRLEKNPNTQKLGIWLKSAFIPLKIIPRYLIPKYFDSIITSTYMLILNRTWDLMSEFVSSSQSNFVKSLALGSVIHAGRVPSVNIPGVESVSLAAGLPHFCTGYMRAWGRDTFISLRGLLILTGRFDEAKNIILGFGGCLRHGLIPNLLDGGYNARYNCRDAVWFWLQSIKDYVELNGPNLLKENVKRLYPNDDSYPECDNDWVESPLEDVIQEALQVHFYGLKFRERNAGKKIDEHMRDEGFNNEIGVSKDTGFVFGGNSFNCGTWMDKMGSSEKAGIKGIPATPRDGSAVEIVGLSYSVLSWLCVLHEGGDFKYGGVKCKASDTYWSYGQWSCTIKDNFEKYFFIIKGSPFDKRPDLINKVGIYKDTYGSKIPWTEYQLRPNFCIAMAVAPELFDESHALEALEMIKKKLLGPLGLATLDPDDWNYRGDYDNSNDSTDSTLAQGINYHQGPEWVWPVGYFLRAYYHFLKKSGKKELAVSFIKSTLAAHYAEIISSHWRGIPELTNREGKYCRDSNPIQAWSMSCILEVLYDLMS